jgi:antitoxin CptB
MPDTDNDLDAPRRRTLYRAEHRGTKEMDWMLGRFAKAELGGMDDNELDDFEEFLALPDPDITNWLLTPGTPAPDGLAGEFVARLKRFHDL